MSDPTVLGLIQSVLSLIDPLAAAKKVDKIRMSALGDREANQNEAVLFT